MCSYMKSFTKHFNVHCLKSAPQSQGVSYYPHFIDADLRLSESHEIAWPRILQEVSENPV